MEIIKEARHATYVEALKRYRRDMVCDREGLSGLCYYVARAYIHLNPAYTHFPILKYFPEVYKYKPKRIEDGTLTFWWNVRQTKRRIDVLKSAIEESK
jgi:hypothetical protein